MKWYMESDSEFEDVDDSDSDPDYIMTDKSDEEIEEETNTKNNQRNKTLSENTSENSDQECDLLETNQEIVAMDNNDDVGNVQFFIEKNNKKDFLWKLVDGKLSPVTMKISCSCETNCGTWCGCRRSRLVCSLACKHCDGNSSNQKGTSNVAEISDEEKDEKGEEDEEEFEQDV
ncbi:unnamed protein product [Psylliodes chrysocephalus]|uniref:Uncharacterized protein n=1 Tax=Psylliodes chrysocephalus TaxID=3402493 RepID=A0A9P0G7T5_9CUCU|nr:unnamed protein product [Psylliodes chrysocephala]